MFIEEENAFIMFDIGLENITTNITVCLKKKKIHRVALKTTMLIILLALDTCQKYVRNVYTFLVFLCILLSFSGNRSQAFDDSSCPKGCTHTVHLSSQM